MTLMSRHPSSQFTSRDTRRVRRAVMFGVLAVCSLMMVNGCGESASGALGQAQAEGVTPAPPAEPLTGDAARSQAPGGDASGKGETGSTSRGDFEFSERGALDMAEGLRQAAVAGESEAWLKRHAVYPFDVDGALRARDIEALLASLRAEHPELGDEIAPLQTCEARTRAQLLDGADWHYIDRLGGKPPRDELARDLDRLGLVDGDWLVNCYQGREPGFFVIVTEAGGLSRLRALRK